jgi:hypothetical protein
VCDPDLPTILGADLIIDRITLAGNKFGQPQVLKVDMDCGNASRGGSPKKRAESFSWLSRPLGNEQRLSLYRAV